MAKSKSLAPQPLVVRTYEELDKYVRAFVQGHLGLMILTGNPGLGKSHGLKTALGADACHHRGQYDRLRHVPAAVRGGRLAGVDR